MKDEVHRSFLLATTIFGLLTATANVGIARVYTRGVEQLQTSAAIDERDLRVLARPVRLRVGQRFPQERLEEHLDRIGFYRLNAQERGCYTSATGSLSIWARYPELPDITVQWSGDQVASIRTLGGQPLAEAAVEGDTIAAFAIDATGSLNRTSIVSVPFATVADTPLLDAVIASEDRAFRQHHGLDFMRLAAIPWSGGGASTITMQVARLNVLQDRRRTISRKANEMGVAMAMERLYHKDAILSAYLNTVDLGARRGRPIHGFGAAAREFFGIRDLRQLTAVQAATLAALLNQPSRYLDELYAGDDTRLQRQRNRVLRLMHQNFPDRYDDAWLAGAEAAPVALAAPLASDDAVHRVSRHFLDYALPSIAAPSRGRVYVTLDARLQQLAAEAIELGVQQLASRVVPTLRPEMQAALLAIDAQTGEILAMVGGRSYNASQFNRAISARRQLGSIMKPFDYLAAFERAAIDKAEDVSPEVRVADQPTLFTFNGFAPWQPANYDNNYAGTITWRRALAESRNIAAVKVAAWAGFERVAALWGAASGQANVRAFPSISLGAIQATPAEVATAYSLFATGGVVRPLRSITAIVEDGRPVDLALPIPRRVARAESATLVRDMMRSVMDEGTGRSARAAGFQHDAAGKTGTTDNLRDAWFAGFAGDLLTVVWVGRDDDRPLGFTGAQAALPIWTSFMKRALEDPQGRE